MNDGEHAKSAVPSTEPYAAEGFAIYHTAATATAEHWKIVNTAFISSIEEVVDRPAF